MSLYPLTLNVASKRVLVVGAGAVAGRRIQALLAAEADVLVVAPVASDAIRALAHQGRLTFEQRAFVESDVLGAWLVITAVGVDNVDAAVARAAQAHQIWCVNSADASDGSAITPAVAHGPDGVAIAVAGGGDPNRAIAIRDVIDALLQSGSLPLRRTRQGAGHVSLVGGGPGDPDLVTVRGRQVIAAADVLVVDRLAPAALWADPADGVEIIDVGKAPGKHIASQEEINRVIVEKALAGNRVVRIKGGDPFVLGRGGEEALACIAAGVSVEIVPGITSAIAVPAAVGIPVTQRGITASFVVASAHEGPSGVLALTQTAPEGATIILLMGAGRLQEIAAGLISAGRADTTPLALIESGWTPEQKTTISTLSTAAAGGLEVHPPAVVVVGEVVRMREQLGNLGLPSVNAGHPHQAE